MYRLMVVAGPNRGAAYSVSDNGETTAFRFPGNSPMPAIYRITPDGKEQIAAMSVDDDIAVVHGTAAAWRLRRRGGGGLATALPSGVGQ